MRACFQQWPASTRERFMLTTGSFLHVQSNALQCLFFVDAHVEPSADCNSVAGGGQMSLLCLMSVARVFRRSVARMYIALWRKSHAIKHASAILGV